jgi:hypothetical protein
MWGTETWTDNFNQTATNKQQDFRTILGPGVNLLINGPTTKGILSGNAGLTYDTAPSTGFNVFPTGSAALQQTLSPKLSLTLTDAYTRSDDPTQPIHLVNTQRQTFTSNSFSAAANYQIDRVATQAYYRNSLFSTGGTNGTNTVSNLVGVNASTQIGLYNTAQMSYARSWIDTSGTSSGSNSGQTTGSLFTASLSRQTGQYSTAGLSGSYQELSLPQSGDQQLWNVSLFAAYGLPSGLSLSGSIGYGQLSSNNQPTTPIVSGNSNLSYRFFQPWCLSGSSRFRQTGSKARISASCRRRAIPGHSVHLHALHHRLAAGELQPEQPTERSNSSTLNSNNLIGRAS